jgi:hypothetical protein
MRPSLLFLIILGAYDSSAQETLPVKLPTTNIVLMLPDSNWHSSHETDTAKGVYFFKRNPVIDSQDRSIIPAIMAFVEETTVFRSTWT